VSKAYRIVVALGISCFFFTLWMFASPHWFAILSSLITFTGLTVMLFVSIFQGWVRWRKMSQFWMLPALICLVFMLLAWFTPPFGRWIADWRFRRHLNEYARVVREVKDGPNSYDASANAGLAIIEVSNLPRHVRAIKGIRCNNGSVVAAFLLDTDVPLLHEGYVYKGYEEGDSCIKESMMLQNNWPYIRHVTGSWYHFSDEPGL
jgi:hypothetical protein